MRRADSFPYPSQDYDLDYDDDDDDEGGEDADAENMYYKAKGKTTQAPVTSARTLGADRIFYAYSVLAGQVEDEPEDALVAFREIVDAEESKGDWSVRLPLALVPSTSRALALTLRPSHLATLRGFKALKQMTKLLYCTLLRPQEALKTYIELLSYTTSAVTRNCQYLPHGVFVSDLVQPQVDGIDQTRLTLTSPATPSGQTRRSRSTTSSSTSEGRAKGSGSRRISSRSRSSTR